MGNNQINLLEPKSNYKTIEGQKYDAALLEEVEDAANTAKDGLISEAEAKRIWEAAADGKGLTEIEADTLRHALSTCKFSDAATAFLSAKSTVPSNLSTRG